MRTRKSKHIQEARNKTS
uniref:Uncharacterized protein n=1 Tax=Arundo donax TaxID=35708 RepID=A0A0A9ASP8_ARUDO